MSQKQAKFTIVSTIEAIDDAVVRTVALASDAGFADDAIFAIDMAMRGAVANAVKHGNKLVTRRTLKLR